VLQDEDEGLIFHRRDGHRRDGQILNLDELNQCTLVQEEENLVVKDGSVDVVVKNVKKNVKKNARHEKRREQKGEKREQKREQKGEKRERVENKYLVKILYNIYNIYMDGNKSNRNRVKYEKFLNWKKTEKEDDNDIMTTPLSPRRIETHSKKGIRVVHRHTGRLDRPPSKKLLNFGDMNVKKTKQTVRGKKIRGKSKRPKGTVRRYGDNPDYTPSPKKKSCCERWFRWGSKKRNKKCKKKCKTRKRKRKKRTKKKKIKRKR